MLLLLPCGVAATMPIGPRLSLLHRRDRITLGLEPPGGAEVVDAGGEADDLGLDVADLDVHVVAPGPAVLLAASGADRSLRARARRRLRSSRRRC